MLSVITISVNILPMYEATNNNYTYWAYIHNPPSLRPVTWDELPPAIYINDSSWLPGPEDSQLLILFTCILV